MKKIPILEIMSRDVVTVRRDTPIVHAVELLVRHHLSALPVVDDDRQIVGILSETDFFLKPKGVAFSLEKVPTILGQIVDREDIAAVDTSGLRVEDVMSRAVTCVRESMTLADLAMLMYETRHTCLPVTRDGRLVGVVTRSDVLRAIYRPEAATEAAEPPLAGYRV